MDFLDSLLTFPEFSSFTFDLEYIWNTVIPVLNKGLLVSISLIIPSILLGFFFGVLIGTCRVYGPPGLKKLMNLYTMLVRSVPLLVQMFILYYGLPKVGITFSPYVAGVLAFTMCSAAYHSEYIRGALLSIKQGQIKASQALGFTSLQSIIWVIVPQAVRRALPGCGNEFIYLIKYSSLASAIVMMDLTGEAAALANTNFRYTEVYLPLGAYYLFLTSLSTLLVHRIEKKLAIPGFGVARARG